MIIIHHYAKHFNVKNQMNSMLATIYNTYGIIKCKNQMSVYIISYKNRLKLDYNFKIWMYTLRIQKSQKYLSKGLSISIESFQGICNINLVLFYKVVEIIKIYINFYFLKILHHIFKNLNFVS